MNFIFRPLTIENVYDIMSWKYDGYMKTIFMKPYIEHYNKNGIIKGPLGCEGYGVFINDTLCGLFEYYWIDDVLEIGLALHPNYVGKGYSNQFINNGINFAIMNFDYHLPYVQLHVEKNNLAAYHAYKKNGFIEIKQTKDEIEMHKYLNKTFEK